MVHKRVFRRMNMVHYQFLPDIEEECGEIASIPWSVFDEWELSCAFRSMRLAPDQLMSGMSPNQVESLRSCGEEITAEMGFYCTGEIDVDLEGLKRALRRFTFDLLLDPRDLRTLRVNLSCYDNPSLEASESDDEGEMESGDDEVFFDEVVTSQYRHGPLRKSGGGVGSVTSQSGGGVGGLRRTFSELSIDPNLLPK